MDRRALFFLGAAAVCAVLTPITDDADRWVPIVLGATYVVLAIASMLDAWGRRHSIPEAEPPPVSRTGP
ncbi:MAG: hypothetical protein U0V73_04435 [Acidimicrobiia bacterium]